MLRVDSAVPLLTIDDISVAESDGRLTLLARRTLDDADPHLAAHFPSFRIFPGVFVLEALRQAVALALVNPAIGILAVRSMRFVAPLAPGDRLTLRATLITAANGSLQVDAEALRNDAEVAVRLKIDCAPIDAGAMPAPVMALGHLPHGHPMLLVDRIVSIEPGQSIIAIKAISGTDPCYRDLGAGLPVSRYAYPTSMLLESFGQAAALLWMDAAHRSKEEDEVVILVGARNCRIEGQAYPGDVLTHEARIEYAKDGNAIVTGETRVGDRRVAVVESMVAALRAPAGLAARGAAAH